MCTGLLAASVVAVGQSPSQSSAQTGSAPLACPPPPGPTAGPTIPQWWTRSSPTFYEAFVRSFSDSNGDGIGDLAGLSSKLDYLSELGVGGLWLMPTFPSPSYHGYDVTDYRSVKPEYGTLEDLRALVRNAHDRDIKVILDLPLNHTSDQDPWFIASQDPNSSKRDWYVWSDQPGGNNWYPLNGSYYYAAFGSTFPDLNFRNPDVTAAVTDAATFWLKDVGVDGFRLDAAKYLIEDGVQTQNTPETHDWWKAFRSAIDSAAANGGIDFPLTVGEVWDTPQNSSSYVPDDLDMTFDFGYAGALVNAVNSADGQTLGRVLTKITGLYPETGFGSFLTNHDMPRLANQVGGGVTRQKEAAALLLLGPGTPFVYYGEEIGMSGDKPDEQIRTPMRWERSQPAAGFSTGPPWEAISPDPAAVNVADESADPESLLNWYRKLIAFRTENPLLAEGSTTSVSAKDRAVVAELRAGTYDPYRESLLVLANLGDQDLHSEPLTVASASLCGTRSARPLFGGATAVRAPQVTATGGFTDFVPLDVLPAHSVNVIRIASR